MRTTLSAVAVLAMFAAPAFAEMRYDHKIEQAAMEIVAGKIGDIRGGFSYAQKVQLVVRQGEVRHAGGQAPTVSADNAAKGGRPPSSAPRL